MGLRTNNIKNLSNFCPLTCTFHTTAPVLLRHIIIFALHVKRTHLFISPLSLSLQSLSKFFFKHRDCMQRNNQKS